MRILLWYFVVMIGLLAIARNRPWGGPLAGTLFLAMGVSLVWAAWIRCPKCGRWLSRNEFAASAVGFCVNPMRARAAVSAMKHPGTNPA